LTNTNYCVVLECVYRVDFCRPAHIVNFKGLITQTFHFIGVICVTRL